MDPVLLMVTVGALLLAIAMSVVAWRSVNEEKKRTAARVATLRAAADAFAPRSDAPAVREGASAVAARGDDRSSLESFRSEGTREGERSWHEGFLRGSTIAAEGAGRQRGLLVAAAVLTIALVALGAARTMGTASAAATAAAATPLELLSLRHEREGARLSVAGLVRNPGSGSPVERLTAVVFLFDQQGTFVTSSRAPVDFVTLGAGDESPFVVKLDAPQTVSRYRVSFRTDDQTMPHVDRRGEPAIAAPVSLSRK